MKVQISFAANTDLVAVKERLIELVEKTDYEFVSCFLPRHIVKEKGFTTDIVDMLDEVLGDRHKYAGIAMENFDDFMANIYQLRFTVGKSVDVVYLIGSGIVGGIKDEINIASNGKIILL